MNILVINKKKLFFSLLTLHQININNNDNYILNNNLNSDIFFFLLPFKNDDYSL